MMNFTILAIISCYWAVLVAADFYLEFKAPTATTSRAQYPRMARYLYECRGIPAGTPAYTAPESVCTLVNAYEQRIKIYLNCNFYAVYRPKLEGQVVHFSDNRRVVMSEIIWYVGYKNDAIDHPNFTYSETESLVDFIAKAEQMAANGIVPQQLVSTVAHYLVKTNIVILLGQSSYFNRHLAVFANVLNRITYLYSHIDNNAGTAQALREQYGDAMRVVLEKMIDPCSVLAENFLDYATEHCGKLCNFLTVVARHFGPVSSRCSSLEGGHCLSRVCTCSTDVVSNPFAGCHSATSPMQLCNNEMRVKLKL